MSKSVSNFADMCRHFKYTVAGIGIRLRPCANALRCKACQVQPQQFQNRIQYNATTFLRTRCIAGVSNLLPAFISTENEYNKQRIACLAPVLRHVPA